MSEEVRLPCDLCGELTGEKPLTTCLGLVEGPRWCDGCQAAHCDPPYINPLGQVELDEEDEPDEEELEALQAEQLKDEKRGLYPDKEDIAN